MKYLLDTCVISDFVKGHPLTLKRLKVEAPKDIAISSVTLMEINFGLALNPARAKKIRPIITDLTESITILPYENNDAKTTALIRAQLQKQGKTIGPYDIMIAGTALSRQLMMVTSNTKEFNRITGLNLEDWSL